MLTREQLATIETRLHKRLLARLSVRWPHAKAHVPEGSAKVHVAGLFPHGDEQEFDVFVLGYQDAISDFMEILDPPPTAHDLLLASTHQGVVAAFDREMRQDSPRRVSSPSSGAQRRGAESSQWPRKPAKTGGARPARRDSAAARAGLRRLFGEGGSDEV